MPRPMLRVAVSLAMSAVLRTGRASVLKLR